MKSVDTGKDKVKKICEVLRRETLDPAKKEADLIIRKAREDAAKIIADAKKEAGRIHLAAKKTIEEERNVFEASINLSCKKSLSMLRQEIEKEFFNPQLKKWIGEKARDPSVIAALISAIVKGIEKEGIDADLKALIPASVSPKAVNEELLKGVIERLKQESVQIGEFEGGAQVKLVDQNMTVDVSEEALKNLVASFVRDDFRSIVFGRS